MNSNNIENKSFKINSVRIIKKKKNNFLSDFFRILIYFFGIQVILFNKLINFR